MMVARQRERLQSEAERLAEKFGVKTTAVSCDVATSAGVDEIVAAAKSSLAERTFSSTTRAPAQTKPSWMRPTRSGSFIGTSTSWLRFGWRADWCPSCASAAEGSSCTTPPSVRFSRSEHEPIYNVTKAALMMFSKTLSLELVKDNIRVNTINPGLILTPDWIKDRDTADRATKAVTGKAISTALPKSTLPSPASPHRRNLRSFFVVPLFGPRELFGGIGLLR